MPLTEKGQEIKSAMEKEYGSKKGESVFYASANKGTITGVHDLKDDGGPGSGPRPGGGHSAQQHPPSVNYGGKIYSGTGKVGTSFKTGEPRAEYTHQGKETEHRVWHSLYSGQVTSEDKSMAKDATGGPGMEVPYPTGPSLSLEKKEGEHLDTGPVGNTDADPDFKQAGPPGMTLSEIQKKNNDYWNQQASQKGSFKDRKDDDCGM